MARVPRFLQTPEPTPKALPEEQDGTLIGWIHGFLSRVSASAIEQGTVVAVLLLGALNFFFPAELAFSLFYLAPISAAAWYTERSGYFVASLAAATWTLGSHQGLNHPMGGWGLAWDAAIHLGLFMVVAVLTSRLKEAVGHQKEAENRDSLTGLSNHTHFRTRLTEELDRALRYGRIFTVAYLDLDRFKDVNDTRGHAEGDQVLKTVARIMDEFTRTTDLAARVGGDEFALLLPETPYAQAEKVLSMLRRRIKESMEEEGWPTSVSIGAVSFEAPVNSADEALGLADRFMYEVKEQGGDGVRHILWTGEDARLPGPADRTRKR
jgi:diguanylate cyclase (GGDEF)-like protein